MANFSVSGIEIQAIAAAVPQQLVSTANSPLLEAAQEQQHFIKNVGIAHRRVASAEHTAADLCLAAAEKVLDQLQWDKATIDVLCLVTQTPDYLTPGTSTILQDRLGLSQSCLCFDINLGCSAFPYGLATVVNMLKAMPGARGLLLIGDKSSQLVSPTDKSTALLFSDAGSAIALANTGSAEQMHFSLFSDGSGYRDLMVKGGGGRYPFGEDSLTKKLVREGVERHALHLEMNGIAIFNFTIRQVLPTIKELMKTHGKRVEEVDFFVFHQANRIINESLRKMLKIPVEKCPSILHDFGNPSSASIPLTVVQQLREPLGQGAHQLLASGFGVGLSWGNVLFSVKELPIIPLIEIG
ncbi:3-oxoacyl-ACP synthase III family protein [Lewinella sp. LCG006]|uniref:3-oxoacyl-ACP synthase III family protein n=1 Tax=Lewinella sp. LCG006 TaxID=3231911 RepID=UPI0034603787